MSVVSTIFVFCASYDQDAVEELLNFITLKYGKPPFKKIRATECGGDKVCQSAQFYAAFNLVSKYDFLKIFNQFITAKIKYPQKIQILAKDENDYIFSLLGDLCT